MAENRYKKKKKKEKKQKDFIEAMLFDIAKKSLRRILDQAMNDIMKEFK